MAGDGAPAGAQAGGQGGRGLHLRHAATPRVNGFLKNFFLQKAGGPKKTDDKKGTDKFFEKSYKIYKLKTMFIMFILC